MKSMKAFVTMAVLAGSLQSMAAVVNHTTSLRPTPGTAKRAPISRVEKAAKGTSNTTSKSTTANGYSTSHSFEGSRVNGQLQEGSLRRIMVENDNSIDDLLGVIKQFDDRESDEGERNLSW